MSKLTYIYKFTRNVFGDVYIGSQTYQIIPSLNSDFLLNYLLVFVRDTQGQKYVVVFSFLSILSLKDFKVSSNSCI